MIKKHQAYAWDGKRYLPIGTAIYNNPQDAIEGAKSTILDGRSSVVVSVRKNYRKKPVVSKLAWWCKESEEKI